jgi:hypothetical protein
MQMHNCKPNTWVLQGLYLRLGTTWIHKLLQRKYATGADAAATTTTEATGADQEMGRRDERMRRWRRRPSTTPAACLVV